MAEEGSVLMRSGFDERWTGRRQADCEVDEMLSRRVAWRYEAVFFDEARLETVAMK